MDAGNVGPKLDHRESKGGCRDVQHKRARHDSCLLGNLEGGENLEPGWQNNASLAKVAKYLKGRGLPWTVAGDMNNTPEVVRAFPLFTQVWGRAFEDKGGTCVSKRASKHSRHVCGRPEAEPSRGGHTVKQDVRGKPAQPSEPRDRAAGRGLNCLSLLASKSAGRETNCAGAAATVLEQGARAV